MCSEFTLDFRYVKSNIKCVGQCVGINFAFTKSRYNLLKEATINVLIASPRVGCAIFTFKNKELRFLLTFCQGIFIVEGTWKSCQDVIGDLYCPTYPNEKCVYPSTNRTCSFYDCEKCKACSHVPTSWIFFLRTKDRQLCCLTVLVQSALQELRALTTKKRYILHFRRLLSANHNQAHPNLSQNKQKFFHLRHNRVDSPLVVQLTRNSIHISFYTPPV